MVVALPIWQGWTVDLRLRQFRKVKYDDTPNHNPIGVDMISFDSEEAQDIYYDYCQDMYDYHIGEAESFQRIQFDIEAGLEGEEADMLIEEMLKEV